ncbi:uncharacterized protein F4812DRAFT_173938 [Daldinia caldariorum]|uniref:uncharacterized protein n=1 Tax=Daldinia caldariorum TaxID=326644 RepID=UPI002008BAEC|nr:uncharacterized protein F4812DRAFT_173938 [Daldinia caldariorum]KAI1471320.1 hypothetical protein F4812DRAFT_173938 [Daldinia caldariorum]
MYSPYGSYSSMSEAAQPMEIPTTSYLARNSVYSASCAFPSWPRRSSLTDSAHEERATSYLSDDDLFPCDMTEDDAHSVSSAGSTTPTSPVVANEVDLLRMQREQMAMQREAIKFLLSEKERRKQQLKRQRRSSGGSSKKSSPKSSKSAHLDAIAETGE